MGRVLVFYSSPPGSDSHYRSLVAPARGVCVSTATFSWNVKKHFFFVWVRNMWNRQNRFWTFHLITQVNWGKKYQSWFKTQIVMHNSVSTLRFKIFRSSISSHAKFDRSCCRSWPNHLKTNQNKGIEISLNTSMSLCSSIRPGEKENQKQTCKAVL